jgi:hypothetical protein
MAEIKTKKTKESVATFLSRATDADRRADCRELVKIFEAATRAKGRMWGTSIVGFGDWSYANSRGDVNPWFMAGFSPRKSDLVLYLMGGRDARKAHLPKLGKHRVGGSCVYVKRLADVDRKVLTAMIRDSVKALKSKSRA